MKESNIFFLGTKDGICPFCGKLKILILVRGGIISCKDCLDILASILKTAHEPISKGKLTEKIGVKEA